jgi:putative tricarboxylic transport membrane protein
LNLRYLEGIAAAALGAAAAFYLHTALQLPVPRYGASTTPGFLPTVYASLMLFLCAALFGKALLARAGNGAARIEFSALGLAKIGLALAALLAFALLLDTVGFLLSSFLFLVAVTPLFGRVPIWVWIAAPGFLAVSAHLVFVTLLKLRLPAGFLPLPF